MDHINICVYLQTLYISASSAAIHVVVRKYQIPVFPLKSYMIAQITFSLSEFLMEDYE